MLRTIARHFATAGLFAVAFADDHAASVLVLPVIPPPVVVPIERTTYIQTAPPEPAPAEDPLGCTDLPAFDEPAIGKSIDIRSIAESTDISIAAAAAASVIAVRDSDGSVRISDDDGASFRRAFTDHATIDQIGVDRFGTVYARSGHELAARDPATHRTRWRPAPFDGGRFAVDNRRVVWFFDEQIAASRDRGATWQPIHADVAWSSVSDWGELFTWRGSTYQILHYEDMCGVDDWAVYQLTGARVSTAVFHAGYGDDHTFDAADDVGTSWTWRAHCPDCRPRDRELLAAQKLHPVEGARSLAVYDHALVELCPSGARQIYRSFPLERLAAVDSHGRPLVTVGRTVARWSRTHGWRALVTLPERVPEATE